MHDWRGTPVAEGSRVVYPVRQGSSMWMTEIEVTEVVPGKFLRGRISASTDSLTHKGAASRNKAVIVYALERVTVVD